MNVFSLFSAKPSTALALPEAPAVPQIDVHFTSIISEEMESEGNIYLRGNLRIDGMHVGDIKKVEGYTDKKITVHVSKTGTVDGSIDADYVIIDGEVSGKTIANNNLHIRGTVKGEAYYGQEVDVTGIMSAHLVKMCMTEAQIETGGNSENVHPLPTPKKQTS